MSNAALNEDGLVLPGLESEILTGGAGSQVWCLFRARDGSIYAGTGSEGSIYRIGKRGAIGVIETFEYEVFALAEGPGGEIYAAGAPNGTILEIQTDGSARTVSDTPEKIVWSLLTDPQGNLYAATGDRGCLYKISSGGEATVLHRAEESHLVCLAWSADGKLLAGTEGRGLLLEIDPATGSGRVLYDSPFTGISQLVVAPDGSVYFAATQAGGGVTEGGAMGGSTGDSGEAEGTDGTVSRLLVRQPNGSIRTIWQSSTETIHTLLLDGEDGILVGTGSEAALYRVGFNGQTTLLWKPQDEGQVLALHRDGEAFLAGTGNPGTIYRLGPARSKSAWIRPEPITATSTATWGRAIWEVLPGSGRWELRTRSGHTEKPDSSWSPWSPFLTDPEGSAIASPPGRFLQCEASYSGNGEGEPARLRQIWVPFSEQNLAPRVRSIRFSSESFSTDAQGTGAAAYTEDLGAGLQVHIERSTNQNGENRSGDPPPWVRDVRSIAWIADDPNGDPLIYDVGLRRVGEEAFRSLVEEHPFPAYAIDTRTLPEGSYEVLVTASDAPVNPPGEAFEAQKIGGPFRIDHGIPQLVGLTAKRTKALRLVVEGKAVDASSPINLIEVSWDGRPWRPVAALDGFLDSREEFFRVEIDLEDEKDGSWAAVRVIDTAGNEAVGRVWLND